MTDPLHESDPALEARFRSEHTHIPDEPFVSATLKRVAAERARSVMTRHLLKAGALIAVIVASRWLIEGSVLLSEALDQGFVRVSEWLATPAGMATAVIASVALAALYRVRLWRAGR